MPDRIGSKPIAVPSPLVGERDRVRGDKPATSSPTDAFGTSVITPKPADGTPLTSAGGMKPSSQTSISATWDLGGRRMNPGEELRLEIPEHLRNRAVRSVMLSHRQDPSTDTGLNPATGRDANPGLTAVNLRSIDDGTWRDWNSPWGSSGPKGAKFAEQRGAYNPEFENMFDWNVRGHMNADTGGDLTTKGLHSDQVRVLSLGTDPVYVHKVVVNVMGETPSELQEAIFSPGTAFGDWETGAGRKYGGGQAFQGTFPGAVVLGGAGSPAALPAGWSVRGSSLVYELPPGRVITGVDAAVGDSHPDKIRNKDGGWGTPGWSKLTMALQHADGSSEVFVDGSGVPPEGIVSGAPVKPGQVTQPGDKLVISGSNDLLYVMGVRVGLMVP